MINSWHVRRLAKYCILCLAGPEQKQRLKSVDAYDTEHAFRLIEQQGSTPIAVWSVN
jgi:hypothetical protein